MTLMTMRVAVEDETMSKFDISMLADAPIEELERACRQHGLSSVGSRSEMLSRLRMMQDFMKTVRHMLRESSTGCFIPLNFLQEQDEVRAYLAKHA